MSNILFLALEDALLSLLAGGYAAKFAPPGTEIFCAARQSSGSVPQNILNDDSFDMPDGMLGFEQLAKHCFDIVVACDNGILPDPIAGNPPVIHWNLPPVTGQPDDVAVTQCKRIQQLTADFFLHGYYTSFASINNNYDTVLNNISDAIITHDFNRRIYYFNDAAENLTGFSREEVLNQDCHKIFGDGLCGEDCLFCSTDNLPGNACHDCQRTIHLTSRNGEKNLCDMTVKTLFDGETPVGILATLRRLQANKNKLAPSGNEVFSGIIGASQSLAEVFESIRDIAPSTASTLIYGESGTGKELAARAIHNLSRRKNKLFVPVNCGALPENLLESELFGHVKGAFTGAVRDKKGRFELADGGTIFLDEIGDISQPMQVKLLRVLQEGTFEKVGGETTLKVDVRVVSATNKNLETEIKAGRFREDLYYRLGVVPLTLPPLRERGNDVLMLADYFINNNSQAGKNQTISLAAGVTDILLSYNWPGNIRELQNWIQYALLKCKGSVIEVEHLPETGRNIISIDLNRQHHKKHRQRKLDTARVNQALKEAGGNKVKAAKLLNVGRATLYRFISDNPNLKGVE